LAARIDCSKEKPDGSSGKAFRLDIEKKIAEMTEPAPGLKIKAIPVPDFLPKKRRAGKRVKKQKDKVATTELRKQQNRMTFGEQESEVSFGDDVVGLGYTHLIK
jgi:U4/U6 small nuclear ribonucleoprotein PRP31